MALAYQETLTSIVRLRSGRQTVSDAQFFRRQFIEALRLAQEEARVRGYTDEESRYGRFAVVAFLDETVLKLGSAVFADWARKPLQEELFGVHVAGEIFFQNLEHLMRDADSHHLADVLEVYLLCLSLGYTGKFSISGGHELGALKQFVFARIGRIRGEAADLSPSWRPSSQVEVSGVDRSLRPLIYSALSCFVIVAGLFVTYELVLHSAVAEVESLAGAGPVR